MKFLIIRFSSIGDIVLTTPVVRCLKKQVVTAEVHYLTKASFRPILEGNPYVDKAHFLGEDLEGLIEELRSEDFDYVIDLHHNLRTLKVKKGLGKKSFSFDKLNIQKWLYTSFKWNRMPDRHIVDRYLDTVASFGVKNDGAGLDYFIPPEQEIRIEDIPASHQAGYIGLVIGAALATKKLPLHRLKQICEQARHPLILLGGPEDVAVAEELAAIDPVKIYNACGKFSLNESADLVRRAKHIITHDTGLMHIAAAFKRPILSIWGNTVPEFGMYPYYGENYLHHYRPAGGVRGVGSAQGAGGAGSSGKGADGIGREKDAGGAGNVRDAGGGSAQAAGGVGNMKGAGNAGHVQDLGGGRHAEEAGSGQAAGRPLPYEILEVRGLSCRPCSKIGYKKCPRGHFKCMELQPIERIVEVINP